MGSKGSMSWSSYCLLILDDHDRRLVHFREGDLRLREDVNTRRRQIFEVDRRRRQPVRPAGNYVDSPYAFAFVTREARGMGEKQIPHLKCSCPLVSTKPHYIRRQQMISKQHDVNYQVPRPADTVQHPSGRCVGRALYLRLCPEVPISKLVRFRCRRVVRRKTTLRGTVTLRSDPVICYQRQHLL
jgi:hypothetical protein